MSAVKDDIQLPFEMAMRVDLSDDLKEECNWDIYLLRTPFRSTHRIGLYSPVTMDWAESQPVEIRQQLSILFESFLGGIQASERATSDTRNVSKGVSRERELKWLEVNKNKINALGGNWIAVQGEELVAYAPDFSVVLEKARGKGIEVPFIIYVPEGPIGRTLNQ